jgi:hypothetical protein
LAYAAHKAILAYITDKSDETQVTLSINNLDTQSMLELSSNNCSHLIDALHLPFKMTTNQPKEKCIKLMALLLNKANQLGKDVFVSLLTKACKNGFTPLHEILIYGDSRSMQVYFKEVCDAVRNNWISQSDYHDLLLKPNAAGSTPLHDALKSGNHQNTQAYFNEVCKAITDNRISQSDYHDLLLKPNAAGFTPLHEVLNSGNYQNTQAYFNQVCKAITDNWISQSDYHDLLLKPNVGGFTPMHHAANSNSLDVVNLFLNKLKKALSTEEYKAALWVKAIDFVPSCQRHKSNAPQINALLSRERRLSEPSERQHNKRNLNHPPLSSLSYFNKKLKSSNDFADNYVHNANHNNESYKKKS